MEADGQLAATRKPIKLIARVAVARSVEHVVVDAEHRTTACA